MILSNLIWEEFFSCLKYNLALGREADDENVQILLLFGTIVNNTGCFFYNRINQNMEVFEKIKELPETMKLLESIQVNYQNQLNDGSNNIEI